MWRDSSGWHEGFESAGAVEDSGVWTLIWISDVDAVKYGAVMWRALPVLPAPPSCAPGTLRPAGSGTATAHGLRWDRTWG